MIPNVNPETSISYAYVSANDLDDELVHELLHGANAVDLSYQEVVDDLFAELCEDQDVSDKEAWLICNFPLELEVSCEDISDPKTEGVYEGVKYCTSWLGGALNFFILESPVGVEEMTPCSPCVPGAHNASPSDKTSTISGNTTAYAVPTEWWREEDDSH